MTIAQLFRALFNLGAQSNFWNSTTAADLFWLVFGTATVVAIVYVSVRSMQHRRSRHTHPFGHTFGR
jgi:hypothetical protein